MGWKSLVDVSEGRSSCGTKAGVGNGQCLWRKLRGTLLVAAIPLLSQQALVGAVQLNDGTSLEECGQYYGISGTEAVDGGELTVDSCSFPGGNSLYGGCSSDGYASYNSLEFIGGLTSFDGGAGLNSIYGGYSYVSCSSENILTFNADVTIKSGAPIYGAWSKEEAMHNEVTVASGKTLTLEEGGLIYGAYSDSSRADGNSIVVDGTVNVSSGQVNITGGEGRYSTSNNAVTISGEVNLSRILGGYSHEGQANCNTVTIYGDAEVEEAIIYGGGTGTGCAVGNKVCISGNGTTVGSETVIVGGYCSFPEGGASCTESFLFCTKNTVEISGGTISADISGGYAVSYAVKSEDGGYAIVSDNTLWIRGGIDSIDLRESNLYGWYGYPSIHSNNTLHVDNWSGTVKSIQNFDRLHFTLPEEVANGDILLQVTGTASWPDGTLITIDFAGDATGLESGDSITLIQAEGSLSAGTLCADRVIAFLDDNPFSFTLSVDEESNGLLATLENVLAAAMGNGYFAAAVDRSYFHGVAAEMAEENAGGDNVFRVIEHWQFDETKDIGLFHWFGSLRGDKIRVRTVTGLENRSWHFNIGAAIEYKSYSGNFLAGVAAESSLSDYEVEQSLGNGAGKVRHCGANFFMKQRFVSGTNLALMVRGGTGKIRNDAGSSCCCGHDVQANYHGVQGFLSQTLQISPGKFLEGYGKFSWNRRTRGDLPMTGRARLHIDAVNSLRGQLGLRYSCGSKIGGTTFCGIGFEHEFDGQIGGTINTIDLGSIGDGRRNCSFAEVGMNRKIFDHWIFSGELHATAGARNGWAGRLQIGSAF